MNSGGGSYEAEHYSQSYSQNSLVFGVLHILLYPIKSITACVMLLGVLNSLLLDRAMQCVNNEDVTARSGFVPQVGCNTLGEASGGQLVSKCFQVYLDQQG